MAPGRDTKEALQIATISEHATDREDNR